MSRYLLFAILAISFHFSAHANSLIISTQKQFDDAVDRINKGEEMHIRLTQGTYVLHQSINTTAPLTIKGKRAIITNARNSFRPKAAVKEMQGHYVYRIDESLSLFPLFYDEVGNILPISESVIDSVRVNYADSYIEAPNQFEAGTHIRIPISSNLERMMNSFFSNAYGYFDCGWGVVNFKLNYSDEKYFYCTTLNNCLTKNYNYDKDFYNTAIRYVIYNAELTPDGVFFDDNFLYIPQRYKEVYLVNRADENHIMPIVSVNSDFELHGVSFIGFPQICIKQKAINTCIIKNCTFRNCLDNAIYIERENAEGTKSIRLDNCSFYNCSVLSGDIIYFSSTCSEHPCLMMKGCVFDRYPNSRIVYKNPRGMIQIEGDAILENNVLRNTCRDHIYCGHGINKIHGNVLYNTDSFNSYPDRNFSNDWGIIYCGSFSGDVQEASDNKKHKILIECNLLYGAYAYAYDARGVFVDSGRGDVECINNIILNTQLFSMDCRIIKERKASSIRNRYENNLVTSNYRMMAGPAVEGKNLPILRGNTLLSTKANVTANVAIEEDDRTVNVDAVAICDGEKIIVSKDLCKVMKESSAWRRIKKHVRQK